MELPFYSIDKRTCPRCGGRMSEYKNIFTCNHCGEEYIEQSLTEQTCYIRKEDVLNEFTLENGFKKDRGNN